MKIGVISDIHGNAYALEQVLKDAKQSGVEKIFALGDFVGYYYSPEKVLDLLSEWPFEAIKGNHEVILQQLYENNLDAAVIKEKYGSGHQQALKNLDEKTLQWLFSLPVQQSVSIENVSFQLNHGSPWSIDAYLYPDANRDVLDKCNSDAHDFVLVGHSHYSFAYKCQNSMLINCGSVGQSRQKGGIAYWVLIDTKNKSFQIKETPYDPSPLLNEVQLLDPDFKYATKILLR
ncbi:MAG: metallophosphoesterase family protein [Mucilaginibacter sp.]